MKFYNNYVGGDGVDVRDMTLIKCVFEEGANLIVSGDKHENIVIDRCVFNQTDANNKISQIMIYGSNGVTIKGCNFTNSGYNAIQLAKNMTGEINIQGNTINGTADRAMKIVTIDGAVLNISNNTMTNAMRPSTGEVVQIEGAVLDGAFANNTHNGDTISFTDGVAKYSE